MLSDLESKRAMCLNINDGDRTKAYRPMRVFVVGVQITDNQTVERKVIVNEMG